MASKDFGAAQFTTSIQLKNTVLNYRSLIHENRFYNFRKKNQKRLQSGTINEYWICLDCEREIAGNFKNQFCKVTISNGRVLTNPDRGHHENCRGRTFAAVEATRLCREARNRCRLGLNNPLESHKKIDSDLNSRFVNPQDKILIKLRVPPFKTVEKGYRRWEKKGQEETNLPEENGTEEEICPVDQKNWLKAGAIDIGVLAFASELDMELMRVSTNLIFDGYCKLLPGGFVQIYTIYAWGFFLHEAIPVCHVAMGSRSVKSYKYLFTQLRDVLTDPNGKFGPLRTVHMDYEVAAHEAFKEVFPSRCVVRGCNFHFNNYLDSTLQILMGCDQIPDDEGEIRKWINCFKSLALIPPNTIPIALKLLRQLMPSSGNQNVTNALKEFYEYFVRYWIKGSYPVDLWNHWTNQGPRTTNLSCEYHEIFDSILTSEWYLTMDSFIQLMRPLHERDQRRIEDLFSGRCLPSIRDDDQIQLECEIKDVMHLFYERTERVWPNLTSIQSRPDILREFEEELRCFVLCMGTYFAGREMRIVVYK